MPFDRSLLPEPLVYFEGEGLKLAGKGKWRTAPCPFHGGTDSLRVNVQAGGFVCMNCGAKGGDLLSFHMQRHGLEFMDACRSLGAWVEDAKAATRHVQKPLPFSARAALEVVSFESLLVAMAACNLAKGIELQTNDRDRLVEAASRIQFIATEIAK